jgi:hypothetical protein
MFEEVLDLAAQMRERRLFHPRQHVYRIAIRRQGAGNEAIITRVMYGRIQNPIQTKAPSSRSYSYLLREPFRNLHYHSNYLRKGGSGIQIVQGGAQ